MASIGGLGSGLDVESLVNQLVALERAPAARYSAARLTALSRQTAWSDIGNKLTALRTAAQGLDTPKEVLSAKAASSVATRVAATASSTAVPGSTSLTVTQLARAEQRTSTGLAGSTALVGAGSLSVTSGLAPLGLTSATPDGVLAAGRHSLVLTAPSAAVLTGAGAPALAFPATAPGNDLLLTPAGGGPGVAATLRASYASVEELAADLGTQLASVADVSVQDGALVLTGKGTGSATSLTLSGGAAAALQLPTTTTAGKDHTASLGGGPAVELRPGATVELSAPAAADGTVGRLTVTAGSGPLTAGTATTQVVRTTSSSTVADVVAALGGTGSPVSAALVETGDGSTTPSRLLLTAAATGTRGALQVTTTLDSLRSLTVDGDRVPALDATLTVGGVPITRSSNTVDDLLPGVTLDLLDTGVTTVTVTRDTEAMGTRAKGLVDALNALITSVGTQTRPGSEGVRGGPLASSSLARSVLPQIQSAGYGATGSATTRALSQLGITVERSGSYAFDSAVFSKAVAADPDGATALLSSFATSVVSAAEQLTAPDGLVSSAGRTAGREATSRQAQIDRLDQRLEIVERRYRSQYAKLDAAMAVLNAQSSRLAGQIGGLPTYSR